MNIDELAEELKPAYGRATLWDMIEYESGWFSDPDSESLSERGEARLREVYAAHKTVTGVLRRLKDEWERFAGSEMPSDILALVMDALYLKEPDYWLLVQPIGRVGREVYTDRQGEPVAMVTETPSIPDVSEVLSETFGLLSELVDVPDLFLTEIAEAMLDRRNDEPVLNRFDRAARLAIGDMIHNLAVRRRQQLRTLKG